MSDYLSHLVARQVRPTEGVRPRTASYFAPESRGVAGAFEDTVGEASRAPLGQVRPHREPWSAVGQVLSGPVGTQAPRSGEARDGVGPLLGEPRSRGGPGVGEGHFGRTPDSAQGASRGERSRERAEALVGEGPARHPDSRVSTASAPGPRADEGRASRSRGSGTASGLGQSSRGAVGVAPRELGTSHEGRTDEARHEPGAAWNSATGVFTRAPRARTAGADESVFAQARTSGDAGVAPRVSASGDEGAASRTRASADARVASRTRLAPGANETGAESPLSRATERPDGSVAASPHDARSAGGLAPRTEHASSRSEGHFIPRGIVPRDEPLRTASDANEATRGDVTPLGLSLALEAGRSAMTWGMARDALAEEQDLPMRPASRARQARDALAEEQDLPMHPASPARQARALAAALESGEGDKVRSGQESRATPLSVTHAPEAPVINVTIGRIEVRAVAPATPPRSVPARPSASPSLEDYLARRNGGGR
ncbi:hypothetical protein LXT21_21155 [Myxococcus sp. K38C18041901]|uniref:hypothetical protein n=1 Tax=Myxococcus guangdongensis TaxID=2906760 RepID=UPI0020A7647C|nr:hypothetical protein [Myxococcus guangdongensis]MCP3061293.1 hypothetical protein [Myxococcus guangdongensis]